MNSLFTKGSYDDFLVLEADISAAVDIHMNGRINTLIYNEPSAKDGSFFSKLFR